jgi:hypothetical protein
MILDYRYRRRSIGTWWCHVTAWRNRSTESRKRVRFAPGDPRFLVVTLTDDRRYILYVMARPWHELLSGARLRWRTR